MIQNKKNKILGIAFILQFITSFTNGVFIKPLWYVNHDMHNTLLMIAKNPSIFRLSILLDVLTALGVIFLGAILYNSLKDVNKNIALTAFGLYVLEGALLVASKVESFTILQISQEYSKSGFSSDLLFLADISYNSMEFVGSSLHMLAFCIGAIMFYYLLFRSSTIPKWLSLWGLLSLMPLLVGTMAMIFGTSIPFVFYVPYVPFELFIGLFILTKGLTPVN